MIKNLRLVLLPFSILYGLVLLIRNKLYDTGVLKSVAFDLPVICVGNLAVGGSGKTPVTEYLVRLLEGRKIAILSRGYGRKTRGFILADQRATAARIGDEPLQYYHKFPEVTVAVCEDRVKGINQLKDTHDLIILDDAFQHRAVRPGFSILLFEYQKLLRPQFLLPAGNLREYFAAYKRADLLLMTKVPQALSSEAQAVCRAKFKSAGSATFFSGLAYQELQHLFKDEKLELNSLNADTRLYLITGIANPAPLFDHLKQRVKTIRHYDFPDHYDFSPKDLQRVLTDYKNDPSERKLIITTEKDAQRLLDDALKALLLDLPVFYLPIKIALHAADQHSFDSKILDYVSSTTRNR
ncbi:tetraacyldisaccharide 4'-kinase [Pedobacter sp. GR22-6]|uniref:tetraacyldisaccharide 4'-kinase n=1 Tax=Pedobacter sp. GR22-6 TaxID=3127957 RepID=UPI00307E6C48